MWSPEILATLLGFGLTVIAAIFGWLYTSLTARVGSLEKSKADKEDVAAVENRVAVSIQELSSEVRGYTNAMNLSGERIHERIDAMQRHIMEALMRLDIPTRGTRDGHD